MAETTTETITQHTPWASQQLRAAYYLARAYDHQWASAPHGILESSLVEDDGGDLAATAAAIEAGVRDGILHEADLSAASQDAALSGILAPHLYGETFDHTTTTGRLSWQIGRGSIWLEIHRPRVGWVVQVECRGWGRWQTVHADRDARPRHIRALREAMAALPWIAGADEALAGAAAQVERRMITILQSHCERIGLVVDVEAIEGGYRLAGDVLIVSEYAEAALGWLGYRPPRAVLLAALRERQRHHQALIETPSTTVRLSGPDLD